MTYDKSIWLKSLHNLFKVREGLSSEHAYRQLIDNADWFDEMFAGGYSANETFEFYFEDEHLV